ncbi:unnamed protein product [Ilex paraguariensis]|uniref:non-specific serine/threonine protein kinase n=1 Tax=Ilex paraguariensis TaxID=185542 RepID=A0ABC8SCT8_9AQUA
MAKSVHFLIIFQISLLNLFTFLASVQAQDQFIYHGFREAKLREDGLTNVHPNGLLQLTNSSRRQVGRAFYPQQLKFNASSSNSSESLSFSTYFVFAIVPEPRIPNGHGFAFTISPSVIFPASLTNQYLGLLNASNNGLASNHMFAVEFDTLKNPEFEDIDGNHVGIDLNSLTSNFSATAAYFSDREGTNKSLQLMSGNPLQVWIDYDGVKKFLTVTIAPIRIPRPNRPLLSRAVDLSEIFNESMYVGFSAATGSAVASNHYVLGWSFNKTGAAQILDPSKLPQSPKPRKLRTIPVLEITVSAVTVLIVMIITVVGIAYIKRKKKYEEIREDWEEEYGPQRFFYKDVYKATKGFKEEELIGAGGFGKVYKGVLPSSNAQIAVKKVSHNSAQGMKEFVAELATMGRLRHRNLVALLGYCRGKGELLLIYDYMPNGSLDKFLFSNEKPYLNWTQRFRILRGIASALLYLHEEWEQVVLHRDVKASNVLLDGDLNGRLGDFGLARLYDHGANPQTTHVVGTVGYLAPELTVTGKATTSTDVFSFGAFMLEMACARRPMEVNGLPEEMILVDWVFEKWRQGTILETCDPKLGGDYVLEEMELVLKLGLICSHSNPAARPSMRQVMQFLDGDAILPDILIDSAGVGMVVMGSEAPNSFELSSYGKISVQSMSSNDSVLHVGR